MHDRGEPCPRLMSPSAACDRTRAHDRTPESGVVERRGVAARVVMQRARENSSDLRALTTASASAEASRRGARCDAVTQTLQSAERIEHLTRTRSATAGEGARRKQRGGWNHGKCERRAARGSLHRLVRCFGVRSVLTSDMIANVC